MVADPTEVTECRWVAVDETKAIAYEELEALLESMRHPVREKAL
jgi:hypothetical protein